MPDVLANSLAWASVSAAAAAAPLLMLVAREL